MFWQDPGQGIHHAAVITAVVDGHVYYSQHSGSQQNSDWNLRQAMYSQIGDPQNTIVVQPTQDGTLLAGQ